MKFATFFLGITLVFTSISANAYDEPFLIVSDIDDTVKITNVGEPVDAVKNGLFGRRVFQGMPLLLQELVRASSWPQALTLLSGSPLFLEGALYDLLVRENHIPASHLVLRDWFSDGPTKQFKMRKLKRLATISVLPLLLIGDDTEHDPEAYTEFQSSVPNARVLRAYIHQVRKRALPFGATPYYTAFDIALNEFEDGRLSSEQVILIGTDILTHFDGEYLFPDYTHCPESELIDKPIGTHAQNDERIAALNKQLSAKIFRYCTVRNAHRYLDAVTIKTTKAGAALVKNHSKKSQKKLVQSVEQAFAN